MPAAAGTGMPLRIDVEYPIGFLKGSEDAYSKFVTLGEKWTVESFNMPEDGKIALSPVFSGTVSSKGGFDKPNLVNTFRFNQIDGDGNGIKTETSFDGNHNMNVKAGYVKKIGGDEHRLLANYSFTTAGRSFAQKSVEAGYRVISKDFFAQFDTNALSRTWSLNVMATAQKDLVVGAKVDSAFAYDVGVGFRHDLAQGSVRYGSNGNITVLTQPRLDTKDTFGLSFASKLELSAAGVKSAGVTAIGSADLPFHGKSDVKLNLTKNGGKISAAVAVIEKLPGKWNFATCASFGDLKSMDLNSMKVGFRITQGSTPPPL